MIELFSNNGWDTFSCAVQSVFMQVDKPIAVLAATLRGQYWVRKDWESGVHSSHLKDDFILSLPQLLVPLSNLQDLASYLEEWLDDPFEFHHDLIDDREQKLSLSFRFEKGHSVLKKYKPWCTIDFHTSHLSGSVEFITDQSCLRIFMEGLAEASREAVQRLTSQSRLPKER